MAAQGKESQTSETVESSTRSDDSGWETESLTDYSVHHQPIKMMNPEALPEDEEKKDSRGIR